MNLAASLLFQSSLGELGVISHRIDALCTRWNGHCGGRVVLPMQRFHFHVWYKQELIVADQEGVELDSIDDARQEAVLSARELLAEALRGGVLLIDYRFEIHDEVGVVLTFPFRKSIERFC
jgi:hypothetical protein